MNSRFKTVKHLSLDNLLIVIGESETALNFITHGVNAIYIILDVTLVSGVPIRIYHVIHTIATMFIYVLFTIIYDLTGRKSVQMLG